MPNPQPIRLKWPKVIELWSCHEVTNRCPTGVILPLTPESITEAEPVGSVGYVSTTRWRQHLLFFIPNELDLKVILLFGKQKTNTNTE